MSSGFPGGGGIPDLYSSLAGRSIAMNGNPSQPSYRSSQLPGIFVDPTSSQIANRAGQNLIGKRTFTDYQNHHQQQQQQQQQHLQQNHFNPALNSLFLRSVKPRTYQNLSPISPLSPVDFSANNNVLSPDLQQSLSHRYNLPLLQQHVRPYQQQLLLQHQHQHQHQQQQQHQPQQPVGLVSEPNASQIGSAVSGVSCANNNNTVQNRVQAQDSEKKMLNRLQELEKQLLDDNDEEEGDAVSVITNTNSEWSETIQNLISFSPKQSVTPISPSPTSSSSSSSSVASPVSSCSKQTVIEAATAFSEGKYDVAAEILTRLSQASNSKGNSEQRLMEYMCSALKSRVNPVENPPPVAELFGVEHVGSTQLLYDLSPCFKLAFMAANLAILEATLDQTTSNKIHVIDFDIGQGGQYMNLLHALSARQNGKPFIVKITAVADNTGCEEKFKVVGDMLSQVAERVGVCLHFNVVVSPKLGDLSRDSLGCEPDEPLAVNFAFKLFRMPDESVSTENPRDELLRRVKGLAPRVVTLLEQEMNTNTAPFLGRVNEACGYYGALFDSIESFVPRDNVERFKVEEGLGRKLANSVTCEGRDRVERCEVFGKWRARMSMAGFELKPMSQNIADSLRTRLSSGNRVNPGFTVKEENGGVCFGWMGRTLTVASAWR
ncbi:putative Scarecrow-like protein 8 [Melia azedarach]|uniref:Scarecrow-like protein 8 n=2 Tax=Melia azedarach TaxID=155640 RepID=A0ACC1X4I1_MELAZ|nr:putative Scarecrow-like protein 8 [Melia azedarach]KAJ4705974.1 putative Scarecrow-like protein 8 [Melia azedarach]